MVKTTLQRASVFFALIAMMIAYDINEPVKTNRIVIIVLALIVTLVMFPEKPDNENNSDKK